MFRPLEPCTVFDEGQTRHLAGANKVTNNDLDDGDNFEDIDNEIAVILTPVKAISAATPNLAAPGTTPRGRKRPAPAPSPTPAPSPAPAPSPVPAPSPAPAPSSQTAIEEPLSEREKARQRVNKSRKKTAEAQRIKQADKLRLEEENSWMETSIQQSQALLDQLEAIFGAHREAQPGHAVILEDCWRL